MKRLCLLILLALAALLGVVITGSAENVSSPPVTKKHERPTTKQKQAAKPQAQQGPKACPSIVVIVKEIPTQEAKQITAIIQERSYEHWWERPNGAEWALFLLTIPYVLISVGLLCATRRQANITEKAVKTVEAPYLSIMVEPHILLTGSHAGEPDPYPRMVYWFINHGRTPAFLIEMCAMLRVYVQLPPQPQYERIEIIGPGIVAPPVGGQTNRGSATGEGDFPRGQDFEVVRSGQADCFFYGFVRYDDVFGTRWSLGWGWRYIPGSNGLVAVGGEVYNYLKSEKKKT